MSARLVPARVDLNVAPPDFWNRYHEFRRVWRKDTRPDDPVMSDQLEEERLKRANPFHVEHRFEISSDGVMLSWFYGQTARPGTAGYDQNRHLFWTDVFVRPDRRRQGLGKAWLPVLLELMDGHGCKTAGMSTEDKSGVAFFDWLGAEKKLSGSEHRLRLAEVDWAMVRGWVAAGVRGSPGTRIEIYDDGLPEDEWADFAAQQTALLNTMPFEELDYGVIVVTPDHLREWYERIARFGGRLHLIVAREADGTVSAMTDLTWEAHRPALIHQGFTGVRPDARGRGLGKWVKAAMLLHLRELYPSAEWVATDNVGSNAPMLAINRRLGFKEYRRGWEYQISRDSLAARVRRLASA